MVKKQVVILHGWQSHINNWRRFIKCFSASYKIYLPVLPGFATNRLTKPFALDNYISWLVDYLKKNKIDKPILISHSFGARIALKYASQTNSLNKLILINAAGIKNRLNLKIILGLSAAKLGKVIFKLPFFIKYKTLASWIMYTIINEKDYFNAYPELKETMKRIINVDLGKLLNKIQAPTLIIWGAEDRITPISHGYQLNKGIKNSHLVIIDKAGHNLPFAKSKDCADIIMNFIKLTS